MSGQQMSRRTGEINNPRFMLSARVVPSSQYDIDYTIQHFMTVHTACL